MNGLLTVQIQPAQCPFFCLYGSVDSIQDELWNDVEHRRSKGEATFIDQGYNQIQAVAYCLMHENDGS